MDIMRVTQAILYYLVYLPAFWATVFASPIVAVIAWGHLFYKLRRESPYLFKPLLISLFLLIIVFCPILIDLLKNRNYEYLNYFPIAGLILGFVNLNRLILAWVSPSPIKMLGLINGLMMLLFTVLWVNLREFVFIYAPQELFIPLASFSFLMAIFWLVFLERFPLRPSEKSKEKSLQQTWVAIIYVVAMTALCAFISYVAYTMPPSNF